MSGNKHNYLTHIGDLGALGGGNSSVRIRLKLVRNFAMSAKKSSESVLSGSPNWVCTNNTGRSQYVVLIIVKGLSTREAGRGHATLHMPVETAKC